MAYTQQDLDELQAALKRPEQAVTFQGRRTEFRSVDEIQKAIATVQSDLARQSGRRVRRVVTFQNDESDGTL